MRGTMYCERTNKPGGRDQTPSGAARDSTVVSLDPVFVRIGRLCFGEQIIVGATRENSNRTLVRVIIVIAGGRLLAACVMPAF